MISPKHTNMIVNLGNATAKEVSGFIEFVKAKVVEKYGIELETEIELVGLKGS